MPNHYTNVLILWPDADTGDLCKRLAGSAWATDPIAASVPPPPPGPVVPLDWALTHWGTKWGAYEVQAPTRLPGDSFAVQLVFVTAWEPPHEQCREAVAQAARALGVERITWTGLDPYDDSYQHLGEWPGEPHCNDAPVPIEPPFPQRCSRPDDDEVCTAAPAF